jgi:TonB family protein
MSYLNYFLEANISLALFLGAYAWVLKGETDFKLQRLFLLTGIVLSVTFPLLHLEFDKQVVPTLGQLVPPTLLPEIVIVGNGNATGTTAASGPGFWFYVQIGYAAGLVFFLLRFILQMAKILGFLSKSTYREVGSLKIVEPTEATSTFSFFNVIVLGHEKFLTTEEKQKVIHHETIHVKQFHSMDILLVNLLGIIFWFNPILRAYKKIFVQLHEFEADARAVEGREVNEYCNLLARVALESAGFKLANHFNNSLTLKRIKMMRTIKRKIKPWKMAVIAGVIPLTFMFVACQDQLAEEATEIAQHSTMALDVPTEVMDKYDAILKANPGKKFLLMETDENMKPKLDHMQKKINSLNQDQIGHITVVTPTAAKGETPRTFAIVEYSGMIEKINETTIRDDVHLIVDETAFPKGGMPAFFEHIAKNLMYPAQARRMGIEGKVFVEFVVLEDGSVTDVIVKKGIGAGCDEEAVEVVRTSPPWNPGKKDGIAVKQRMVVPIAFKLAGSNTEDVTKAPSDSMTEVVVVGQEEQ